MTGLYPTVIKRVPQGLRLSSQAYISVKNRLINLILDVYSFTYQFSPCTSNLRLLSIFIRKIMMLGREKKLVISPLSHIPVHFKFTHRTPHDAGSYMSRDRSLLDCN